MDCRDKQRKSYSRLNILLFHSQFDRSMTRGPVKKVTDDQEKGG